MIGLLLAGFGCSSKKEEPKPEEDKSWRDRLDSVTDKAKSVGGDVTDKAKSVGGDVADKAKTIGGDVADKAKTIGGDVADKAGTISASALERGKELKSALAKVVNANLDYDFAIDATSESKAEHEARRAGMKQLTVGDTSVGFAQDAVHDGKEYKWQLRIVWRLPDDRTARLSIFTSQDLAEAAVVALLVNIIPLAPTLLHK